MSQYSKRMSQLTVPEKSGKCPLIRDLLTVIPLGHSTSDTPSVFSVNRSLRMGLRFGDRSMTEKYERCGRSFRPDEAITVTGVGRQSYRSFNEDMAGRMAEQDLREIWSYGADDAGVERTDRLIDAVVDRFEVLADQPRAGAGGSRRR
jgi:hypothetical protein